MEDGQLELTKDIADNSMPSLDGSWYDYGRRVQIQMEHYDKLLEYDRRHVKVNGHWKIPLHHFREKHIKANILNKWNSRKKS